LCHKFYWFRQDSIFKEHKCSAMYVKHAGQVWVSPSMLINPSTICLILRARYYGNSAYGLPASTLKGSFSFSGWQIPTSAAFNSRHQLIVWVMSKIRFSEFRLESWSSSQRPIIGSCCCQVNLQMKYWWNSCKKLWHDLRAIEETLRRLDCCLPMKQLPSFAYHECPVCFSVARVVLKCPATRSAQKDTLASRKALHDVMIIRYHNRGQASQHNADFAPHKTKRDHSWAQDYMHKTEKLFESY